VELTTLYLDEPLVLKRAVDIAKPVGTTKHLALFYIHGGGWSAGNREQFHSHLEHFSSHGYWCASAGYRLAPEANWKQQLSDVAEAYLAFLHYLEYHGQAVQHIIVLGSSAGAHLASLLALVSPGMLDIPQKERDNWRRPDSCVSINGPGMISEWPDMNASIRKSIEQVIGFSYDDKDNASAFLEASPIEYVGRHCPSFLFLLAEHEQYFPHEYVHAMSEKILRNNGKAETALIEGTEHGFFYGLKSPEQRYALHLLEAWIARQEA